MKKRMYLLGILLSGTLPLALLLCGALIAIQQVVLRAVMIAWNAAGDVPLETLLERSGTAALFLVMAVLGMLVVGWSIARRWMGSRSIYALCSLPLSRKWLYSCWLISGLVVLLLLACAQYGSMWLASAQYSGWENRLKETAGYEVNALFLAFIRWDFLRPFLPFTLFEALLSLAYLLAPPALTIWITLSIFSKRLPAALGGSGLWMLFAMIASSSLHNEGLFAWFSLCCALLVAGTAIGQGYRLTREGDML